MNIRRNKGITLVALITTVVVLLILAGISITELVKSDKTSMDATKVSELNMVQHAILERYTKERLINSSNLEEKLPGTLITSSEIEEIVTNINSLGNDNISLKGDKTKYKRIENEDFNTLGITNTNDKYIVNYETGEVINETQKVTSTGKILYIYAKNP